ncbi:MAG: J domain-containing protein, partial [Roseibacillus sp.]|nr:J domain-containing protein [Roseibacillus sp.]
MTSTAKPDYWSLLGLQPGCDPAQLKRAFRREARRWHPDLNSNDGYAEERFKLVNEAYNVLIDPRRRAAWEGETLSGRESSDPFAVGFPSFEDYLSVVLGLERTDRDVENESSPPPPPEVVVPGDGPPPPPPPVKARGFKEKHVEKKP